VILDLDPKEQLAVWVDKYVDRLTHLAYTYVHDWGKAEDVVQEAFIKAYRSIDKLKTPDAPLPWLIRIVVNECRTSQRKTWREVVTSLLPERQGKSAEDVYFHRQGLQDVHSAIMSLPEVYRTPVYLFYFEGLSTQEIAEALNITPGAARIRLTRGRARLHNSLERGEEDERAAHQRIRTNVQATRRR
jgi:RNA polymerase sigma-70 factor, ECF subfamily